MCRRGYDTLDPHLPLRYHVSDSSQTNYIDSGNVLRKYRHNFLRSEFSTSSISYLLILYLKLKRWREKNSNPASYFEEKYIFMSYKFAMEYKLYVSSFSCPCHFFVKFMMFFFRWNVSNLFACLRSFSFATAVHACLLLLLRCREILPEVDSGILYLFFFLG